MKSQQVRVADLVFDEALYPRRHIDLQRVRTLARATEGGSKLPPIVICRSTKKMIDGVHRYHVAQHLGQQTIAAQLRDYANDAQRFRDAVALNATHGLPLSTADRLKVIDMAENLGLKDPEVAAMLQTTAEYIEKALKRRYAESDRQHIAAGGVLRKMKIPLKGSVRHLSGEKVSAAQAAALSSAPGSSYMLTVRQLKDAIQYGLLPPREAHPVLWAELETLRELLDDVLSKQVA
jgi:ParB-like chromosome segregation protein Spo0J